MSAYSNGFSCRLRRVVALACAAMLPLAHAAVRHTTAHAPAAHVRTAAAAPAKAQRARGSRNIAQTSHEVKPHGRHAVEARAEAPSRRGQSASHEKTGRQVASRSVDTHETLSHYVERQQQAVAKHTVPASKQDAQPDRTALDRATAERVHAWYNAQSSRVAEQAKAAPQPDAVDTATAADSAEAALIAPVPPKVAVTASKPASHAGEPRPDLSPVAHKATVEDFQRAQQRQTETVRQATVANQARTSTADDAAAITAESHIPSTAPTERVAAPFVHGDFATGQVAAAAEGPVPAPAVKPLTAPPGKMVAQSKPANPALKPVDPSVMDGMSAETFATNDAPSTAAKAAVVLAARSAKPDPMVKSAVLPAAEADDDTYVAASRVNPYVPVGSIQLLPPMKGTHEILVHQNQMAIADGLERIENDGQLLEMRRRRLLLSLPDNGSTTVDQRLPLNRRFARPWSVKFLNDLGRAHYARFGTSLVVTSAARTVAFQRHLVLVNGNAAPPTGDVASPHLYGQALDIAKHGMSVTEIAWMRAYLTPVESDGKIDVEEEFQQSCFHISVYRRYLGAGAKKSQPEVQQAPSRVMQQVRATPAPQKHRRLPTAILASGLRMR